MIELAGHRTSEQKPRKNAALRIRPTVFFPLFRCVSFLIARSNRFIGKTRLVAAAALFQILVKLFCARTRRFHVVMSAILMFEEG